MVRLTLHNPKSPIHLLHQYQLHQLMRERHLGERQFLIRPLQNLVMQTQRSADDEDDFAAAVSHQGFQVFRQPFRRFHLAVNCQGDDISVGRDFCEDAVAFLLFDDFHVRVAQLLRRFFVGHFDFAYFAVASQPLRIFFNS